MVWKVSASTTRGVGRHTVQPTARYLGSRRGSVDRREVHGRHVPLLGSADASRLRLLSTNCSIVSVASSLEFPTPDSQSCRLSNPALLSANVLISWETFSPCLVPESSVTVGKPDPVAAQRDPGSVEPMQTRVGRHETTERALGEYGECSVPTHAA